MSYAEDLERIIAERQYAYGPPHKHWDRTARLWTALLAERLRPGQLIGPEDVARLFILDKVSRDLYRPSPDSLLDIGGYAAGIAKLRNR